MIPGVGQKSAGVQTVTFKVVGRRTPGCSFKMAGQRTTIGAAGIEETVSLQTDANGQGAPRLILCAPPRLCASPQLPEIVAVQGTTRPIVAYAVACAVRLRCSLALFACAVAYAPVAIEADVAAHLLAHLYGSRPPLALAHDRQAQVVRFRGAT